MDNLALSSSAPAGDLQPDAEIRHAILDVISRCGSVPAAARRLGTNRETLARILAGLHVRAGSLAIVRERLNAADAELGARMAKSIGAQIRRQLAAGAR